MKTFSWERYDDGRVVVTCEVLRCGFREELSNDSESVWADHAWQEHGWLF